MTASILQFPQERVVRVRKEKPIEVTVTITRHISDKYWWVSIKKNLDWSKPFEFPLYIADSLGSYYISECIRDYGIDNVHFHNSSGLALEQFGISKSVGR